FTFESRPDGRLLLEYQSNRGLWQFAHGLLEACLAHFGSGHRVGTITDLSEGAGTHVRFELEPSA
ncbi:MAG: heme NO-binding domain-containing protein, partial [Myxococcales bacterium]|nr:heme NO-binding domain-containing protein [Myxococcales bacterium]